jgi:DNA-directed RNA polymerase specialized sigma24 family protein
MESRETDSYGEWAIRRLQAGGNANPLPAEVLAAARLVWPRLPALVASEIKAEGSSREAEALAADIWEGVLRSVGKAIERKGNYASSIRDPESYLLVAFHHRFRRFRKAEQRRRERFPSASTSLDLGLIEGIRDTTWILELERAITVRQITDRMDDWTKNAWQARQFGYSWNEIAARSGLSEQAAKKKFKYGLEKTRQRVVGLLETGKTKEPA